MKKTTSDRWSASTSGVSHRLNRFRSQNGHMGIGDAGISEFGSAAGLLDDGRSVFPRTPQRHRSVSQEMLSNLRGLHLMDRVPNSFAAMGVPVKQVPQQNKSNRRNPVPIVNTPRGRPHPPNIQVVAAHPENAGAPYNLPQGSGNNGNRRFNNPNNPSKRIYPRCGFRKLEMLLAKDPEEIILEVMNMKNDFKDFAASKLTPDSVVLLVHIFANVCQSKFTNNIPGILLIFSSEPYIEQLQRFIISLPVQGTREREKNRFFWNKVDEFWDNLSVVCHKFVDMCPNKATDVLPLVLRSILYTIPSFEKGYNLKLSDTVINDFESVQCKLVEFETKKLLKPSREYEEEEPEDDFRLLPIYPTSDELLSKEKAFIRKNRVTGNYDSVNQYLDIQFRLLREDFIRPLRDGVSEYLSQGKGRLSNVKIYQNVTYISMERVQSQMGALVQVITKGKIQNVERTKRFMFGSLVCFTTDNFKTMLFGKVIDRDIKLLKIGQIVVGFGANVQLQADKQYTMLECMVYFEPYFHVLNALKQLDVDNFPLKKYLVDVVNDHERPDYVEPVTVFTYCRDPKESRLVHLPVVNVDNWPSSVALSLNESQRDALKSALNQKFCIIQGPPGTGKTYLGLKIAKTLLANSNVWFARGPMLVICYTNHALDQFLAGILEQTTDIVRIGGQSKNEALEEYNIKKLRRTAQRSNAALRDTGHDLKMAGDELQMWNAKRKRLLDCTSIIDFSEFIHAQPFDTTWFDSASSEKLKKWLLEEAENVKTEDLSVQIIREIEKLKVSPEENSDTDSEENYFDLGFKNNVDLDDPVCNTCRLPDELISLAGLSKLMQQKAYELQQIEDQMSFAYVDAYRGFRNVNNYRTYLEMRLNQLSTGFFNGRPEHFDLENPFNMTPEDRWRLYAQCLITYKKKIDEKLQILDQEYRNCYERYEDVRNMHDTHLMKSKLVVGMTTTGAAKLQRTLQALKCPIVIVEEAAEVLEAHVIASLTSNCQHLILIGDHKQLRPTTADYGLDVHYNLGISLFERMIKNDFNCTTLKVQHRMRPEIARLVTPSIYDELLNHPSVCEYEKVKGVDKSLFFITHTNPEKESSDNSKENPFEAKYLIRLATYLVINGYAPERITILALYSGQLFKLLNERKMFPRLNTTKITILDNYQGEENDIILLSLVRNNEEKNIGFLKLQNRVCVSLSRAKIGLYIMGNINMLSGASEVWSKIRATLEDMDSVGPSLALRCQNHQDQITMIGTADDFDKVPEGGCMKMCEQLMNCGHTCLQMCHIRPHTEYKCNQRCLKIICELNHICPKRCFQECDKCMVPKRETLPCQHIHDIPCYMSPDEVLCPTRVPATLRCGHKIENKVCSTKIDEVMCPYPCDARIEPCGHACAKLCHALNDPDHLTYKCTKACERSNAGCQDPKNPNHKCQMLCCEKCSPCLIAVQKHRTICPHVYKVHCSVDVDKLECIRPCKNKLDCGHPCKMKCFEPCGNCQQVVDKVILECGHKIKQKCCLTPERTLCKNKCEQILKCGHKCPLKCKEDCREAVCKQLVTHSSKKGLCGHKLVAPCYKINDPDLHKLLKFCTERCTTTLECGHVCKGSCGECSQGRLHKVCQEKCGDVLVCGHACELPCRTMCQPCTKPCVYKCKHSKCRQKCGTPCTRCVEKCARKCKHANCTKLCYEKCSIRPCTEACDKKLECGHGCIGFCGEPCPPLCGVCNKDEVTEVFFGTEEDDGALFVYLEECGHTLESSGLEEWFQQEVKNGSISLKYCPKCKTPITSTQRYSEYTKMAFRDIQTVKKKLFGNKQENARNKDIIIQSCIALEEQCKFGTKALQYVLSIIQGIQADLKNAVHQQGLRSYHTKIQILEEISSRFNKLEKIESTKAKIMVEEYAIFMIKFLHGVTYMSNQIVRDYNLELTRFERIVDLAKIMSGWASCESFTEFTDCRKKLLSLSRYDDQQNTKIKATLKLLNQKSKGGLQITDEVRREIVSAMQLGSGHWFKCQNGHVYAIGECGGAMQVSKCPECGVDIGGTSHTLLPRNALAPEMDGATVPAYPTINNMANYVLNYLN